MANKKNRTDEFSDFDHEELLNNGIANLMSRIATYKDYVSIGYEEAEALKMAGLKKEDLENYKSKKSK